MPEIIEGLVPDLPFADYLDQPGYGSSDLHAFKAGPPAIVPWRRANRDSTVSTKIGSAAHCRILTPDLFGSEWIVKPQGMKFTTKAGKAWRDEHLAAGATLDQMLSWDEMLTVDNITGAFVAKTVARDALAASVGIEVSMFWTCPESGLPRKGRPDWYTATRVHDLKIAVEATRGLGSLKWAAFRNGWVSQLAHNRAGLRANGINIRDGGIVAIAPKAPHHLRTYLMLYSENELDVANLDNENWCKEMKVCHDANEWPGSPEDWIDCQLPPDHLYGDLPASHHEDDDGEVVA